MGDIADASAQREEHAGKERHLHRTTASTSAAASTQSIGHLQQEGSDQGLCGCSCCTIYLCYRHLLGCGSNKQVIMLRSEGLGVPLGALEGLGVLLGGLWLQNSLSAQHRNIRSNLKNTVKYVINTIRRIIRLRRTTHPCYKCMVLANPNHFQLTPPKTMRVRLQ